MRQLQRAQAQLRSPRRRACSAANTRNAASSSIVWTRAVRAQLPQHRQRCRVFIELPPAYRMRAQQVQGLGAVDDRHRAALASATNEQAAQSIDAACRHDCRLGVVLHFNRHEAASSSSGNLHWRASNQRQRCSYGIRAPISGTAATAGIRACWPLHARALAAGGEGCKHERLAGKAHTLIPIGSRQRP